MNPVLRNRNSQTSPRAISPVYERSQGEEQQNQNQKQKGEGEDDFKLIPSSPLPPSSPFKSIDDKIRECLYGSGEVVDLDKLKKLTWNGIPFQYRPICWKLLMVI